MTLLYSIWCVIFSCLVIHVCFARSESFHQPPGKGSTKQYPSQIIFTSYYACWNHHTNTILSYMVLFTLWKAFLFLNRSIVLTGFALGVVTNGSILTQILLYSKPAAAKEKKANWLERCPKSNTGVLGSKKRLVNVAITVFFLLISLCKDVQTLPSYYIMLLWVGLESDSEVAVLGLIDSFLCCDIS